ncbi:hypothetical protein D3C86_1373210 [compost metagenome]
MHSEQHAGGVGGLGEEAVNVIPEREFQAKGHPARTAAHSAGQVDEQRVFGIHLDAHLIELLFQPLASHRVAEKQGAGVLVIDEEAVGIALGLLAPLLHRYPVILGVFHDDHPVFAQLALLPLPRIGGHVHGDGEAELGAHDADGHAEVAGRAHRNAVLAEELAELVREQLAIVVLFAEQPGLDGQPFGVGQHLVDAATGLDGAGDRQVAVFFQQQPAGDVNAVTLIESCLHGRDGRDFGLQHALHGTGLGKGLAQVGGEAGQAG